MNKTDFLPRKKNSTGHPLQTEKPQFRKKKKIFSVEFSEKMSKCIGEQGKRQILLTEREA